MAPTSSCSPYTSAELVIVDCKRAHEHNEIRLLARPSCSRLGLGWQWHTQIAAAATAVFGPTDKAQVRVARAGISAVATWRSRGRRRGLVPVGAQKRSSRSVAGATSPPTRAGTRGRGANDFRPVQPPAPVERTPVPQLNIVSRRKRAKRINIEPAATTTTNRREANVNSLRVQFC